MCPLVTSATTRSGGVVSQRLRNRIAVLTLAALVFSACGGGAGGSGGGGGCGDFLCLNQLI